MTDFVSIANAKELHKGNFKGACIKQSDLKAGSKSGSDWTRKTFTLQDASGEIEITAWNEEINFLEVGQFYEVENPWFKEYEGKWNCNIGQYCKINKVDNPPVQSTIQESTAKPEEPQPEQPTPESINGGKLPEINANLAEFIEGETITLLQIEKVVRDTITMFYPKLVNIDGGKIGMYTKEIYRESKKIKFEKAKSE